MRLRLPEVRFPDDSQPDPDRPDAPPPVDGGPPTAPQPLIDAEIVVPAAEKARRAAQVDAQTAAFRGRRRRRWLDRRRKPRRRNRHRRRSSWSSPATGCPPSGTSAVNGTAGTGTVSVYRGVQGSLLGFPLSSLWSDSGLQVGTLPYFDQELVSKGIPAADEVDAQRIITELQSRAAECQTLFPPTGCPGTT